MSVQSAKVEAFVSRVKSWQREIQTLRSILLDCGLDQTRRWGKPCFMFEGKKVAIVQPFKEHCALMFFKCALLRETHGLLRGQGAKQSNAYRMDREVHPKNLAGKGMHDR